MEKVCLLQLHKQLYQQRAEKLRDKISSSDFPSLLLTSWVVYNKLSFIIIIIIITQRSTDHESVIRMMNCSVIVYCTALDTPSNYSLVPIR